MIVTESPNLVTANTVPRGPETLRFRRILVATDFSGPAQCALQSAGCFAKLFGAQLSIVHAVSPLLYTAGDQVMPYDVLEEALRDTRIRLTDIVQSDPTLRDLAPQTYVSCGSAVETICQIARDEAADLIVMGSHGASGLERLALGSVAECVLRTATCPVLIAGPRCQPASDPLRSIVFATDLKTTGASKPRNLHRALPDSLVADSWRFMSFRKPWQRTRRCRPGCRPGRWRTCQILLPGSPSSAFVCEYRAEVGDPAQTIGAIAIAGAATLIVLGLKESWGLADHRPGSTFSRLVHDAHCPVLGVHARQPG